MKSFLEKSGYVFNTDLRIWIYKGNESIELNDDNTFESRISLILDEAKDLSVMSNELHQHCTDSQTNYHLNSSRANILRPFELNLSGNILEIGAGCGAITRYLGECGGSVLAIEKNPRRASITRSRTRDLKNVTVVSETFENFKCDQKFDVITLISVLKYAGMLSSDDQPYLKMLKRARQLLKPGGQLILAIENQLGLKYFAGAPEDHSCRRMYGLEGRYRLNQPQTFGRKQLIDSLQQAGFSSNELLTPFPDYKLPVSIVSQYGYSHELFDSSSLACQGFKSDSKLISNLAFSPELVWPAIVDNGMAMELTNSFLIIASPSKEDALISSKSLAWHFSTDRRQNYSKMLHFICDDNGKIEIKCRRLSAKVDPSENQRLFTFNLPSSEDYKPGVPLSNKFLNTVIQDGWHINHVGLILLEYVKILCDLLDLDFNEVKTSPFKKLPGIAFDLIPQNIIVSETGECTSIDHEFILNEPIELGHLLFRALIALLNTGTKFGRPEGTENLTRGQFVFGSIAAAGLQLDTQDIDKYLQREGELRSSILGKENNDYLEWEIDKYIPILCDINKTQAQLTEMEKAKTNAEKAAHNHLSELNETQAQLTEIKEALKRIRRTKIYKLLTTLRLISKKDFSS